MTSTRVTRGHNVTSPETGCGTRSPETRYSTSTPMVLWSSSKHLAVGPRGPGFGFLIWPTLSSASPSSSSQQQQPPLPPSTSTTTTTTSTAININNNHHRHHHLLPALCAQCSLMFPDNQQLCMSSTQPPTETSDHSATHSPTALDRNK
ncbi:hypothetical protein ElyMa_002089600 [Elysia marginata]|uniref:Uncharacterized protein n=1 Tax=Elysia marginata TaxID=1093978 RepID=A0AAV4FFJ9_9GAST|nr:hypothetical protein ElyMa_002089600 [Elysia marginata]